MSVKIKVSADQQAWSDERHWLGFLIHHRLLDDKRVLRPKTSALEITSLGLRLGKPQQGGFHFPIDLVNLNRGSQRCIAHFLVQIRDLHNAFQTSQYPDIQRIDFVLFDKTGGPLAESQAAGEVEFITAQKTYVARVAEPIWTYSALVIPFAEAKDQKLVLTLSDTWEPLSNWRDALRGNLREYLRELDDSKNKFSRPIGTASVNTALGSRPVSNAKGRSIQTQSTNVVSKRESDETTASTPVVKTIGNAEAIPIAGPAPISVAAPTAAARRNSKSSAPAKVVAAVSVMAVLLWAFLTSSSPVPGPSASAIAPYPPLGSRNIVAKDPELAPKLPNTSNVDVSRTLLPVSKEPQGREMAKVDLPTRASTPAVASVPPQPLGESDQPSEARDEFVGRSGPVTAPPAAQMSPVAPTQDPRIITLVKQAEDSLASRQYGRARAIAESVLSIDPTNLSADSVQQRAREAEEDALRNIKIE